MPDEPTPEPHEDEHWARKEINVRALILSIQAGTHPAVPGRLSEHSLSCEKMLESEIKGLSGC